MTEREQFEAVLPTLVGGCEHKLGKPFCKQHQPPLKMVVYIDFNQ